MVKITRIERPAPKQDVPVDHYALITIQIGGIQIAARPTEFLEHDGITSASKYATTCPHCGHGIWFGTEEMQGDAVGCPNCQVGQPVVTPPQDDPFINPVKAGTISDTDLDPDLAMPLKETPTDFISAKERFNLP